ncbi:gamma-glutamylcyclotransferase [uncultured Litoreibacter sp.]|uniref:gamma-glutamylcyclotransferase n=1 Tax=uncultured Litoreibacter sp. TaxID=1392394 RepID=UPI00262B444A|nr:gamma-glutamylcyclotransferase [uncultured Litoreibacter sp.]
MGRKEVALTDAAPFFIFGTLRDRQLLDIVAGGNVDARDAFLPGFRVACAKDQSFPILDERGNKAAEGLLLTLTPEQAERLDYYEAPYDYTRVPVTVTTDQGAVQAEVYAPPPGRWAPSGNWSLTRWQDQYGALMREAATEIMAGMGTIPAAQVAKHMGVIRTRAQQRLNAAAVSSPTQLRRPHSRNDVELVERRRKYSQFFVLDEVDLAVRKFDGSTAEPVERAVFVTADAVTVLPYDPKRDRVMLIEQFRAATYLRGDQNPWSLEAIAGRQDPGETFEQTARREALEEAGLEMQALHKVSSYYGSPGANTEYLTSFIGIADLPDGIEGVGGLDSEAEDIRSMLVSFDTLMAALDSGEVENGPLVISALYLARMRASLRS